MVKRKQVYLKFCNYCNPSLLPFKEGKKTICIICCSISQSSSFVGSLEVPAWVIKHRYDTLPWSFSPYICSNKPWKVN